MPPAPGESDQASAFTVLNHEEPAPAPRARNVNVVQPLRRVSPLPEPRSLLDPRLQRALDCRLRRLQRQALRAGLRPRAPAGERPRFVTTVKCGQFLPPPPDLAALLGLDSLYPQPERERIVYSYASEPKAVAGKMRVKRSPGCTGRCAGAAEVGETADGKPSRLHGVAALVAGVVGVKRLVDHKLANGSVAAPFGNVMHDKRVVRGSTFAVHSLAAGDGAESPAARAARTRRRALARRAAAARLRPGTPPPAPGRKHHPIQTEYYLEELFDKGEEMSVGVQTDLFLDRPATPVYVPAKTGADAATQIYPGDLFDFDLEVQPILEVLVGKTTEQALAEVAQEEELAALREQQRRYTELRDAERAERQRLAAQDLRLHQEKVPRPPTLTQREELAALREQQRRYTELRDAERAESQRLAAQDLRLHQEKERRVAEARVAQVAATEARERTAAAVLVQGYVAELLPAVLAGLRDQGYLMERVQRGVDEEFMPWLTEQVSQEIESIITSRDVITEIVREVVEARAELYRAAGETAARRVTPPESITPPSMMGEGEEEELVVD